MGMTAKATSLPVAFDSSSATAARESLEKLRKHYDRSWTPLRSLAVGYKGDNLTYEERQSLLRRKGGRNHITYLRKDVDLYIAVELLRQDDGGSVITRGGVQMVDQVTMLAEMLETAGATVEKSLSKFKQTSDDAIGEAKKRVSQLNDYNARLSTSLANISKTLGDERLARALENADKLASALTLLDELEKRGSLAKVISALSIPKPQSDHIVS